MVSLPCNSSSSSMRGEEIRFIRRSSSDPRTCSRREVMACLRAACASHSGRCCRITNSSHSPRTEPHFRKNSAAFLAALAAALAVLRPSRLPSCSSSRTSCCSSKTTIIRHCQRLPPRRGLACRTTCLLIPVTPLLLLLKQVAFAASPPRSSCRLPLQLLFIAAADDLDAVQLSTSCSLTPAQEMPHSDVAAASTILHVFADLLTYTYMSVSLLISRTTVWSKRAEQ